MHSQEIANKYQKSELANKNNRRYRGWTRRVKLKTTVLSIIIIMVVVCISKVAAIKKHNEYIHIYSI